MCDGKCLHIFLDESGNLGVSGRYFVIAAAYTEDYTKAHRFMKNRIKKAKDKFPRMMCSTHEVKAKDAYPMVMHKILSDLVNIDIQISYIVIDLQHIEERLLNDNNLLYNYATKLLITPIVKNEKYEKINILSDNHTNKVGSVNSLPDYLKTTMLYELGVLSDIKFTFLNSDACNAYVIQIADYVANAIYSKYEYQNCLYYDVFRRKIKHHIRFPFQRFGTCIDKK